MPQPLTLLMAQINPTVGAIEVNAEKIIHIIQTHQNTHDIILFPELAITGYPPEDLLFRPELFERVERALKRIAAVTQTCHVIVGHPQRESKVSVMASASLESDLKRCSHKLDKDAPTMTNSENNLYFNAASIMYCGLQKAIYYKQRLPNYNVFDEERYFTHGEPAPCLLTIKGYQFGLCICEDLWQPGPVEQLIAAGVEVMLCINASPFDYDKYASRESLAKLHAQQGLTVVYVNQTGGQDELVFDGQSFVLDSNGQLRARAPAFSEYLQTVTFYGKKIDSTIAPLLSKDALIYQALVCGLRDYVEKNKFPGVLLGLSGGIDSALTLAIAVDALGAARVHAVMMPSQYTASISLHDALQQLQTQGVPHTTLSIEPAFHSILTTLAPAFNGMEPDITEENVQARIRGVLLMALSNKLGYMVLTTSNKSETAVGYTTLYGDMCGGFGVLKDVLKTTVYKLAHYRNRINPVIPERVITRAPTAELALNQTDQDSLPNYNILDAIITHYMVDKLSVNEIVQQGYQQDDVNRVIKLITRNEYKRRQAAPGVKISSCAFGRDWRYPITSGF